MKKVLFVTSRVDDARELTYRALNVWSITMPTDLALAPALAASGNFDLALFDIGLVGAWAPDLLRNVIAAREGFPVFILSREYALCFQALATDAGASGYISIPYSFPSLKKKVDRFLVLPADCVGPASLRRTDASVAIRDADGTANAGDSTNADAALNAGDAGNASDAGVSRGISMKVSVPSGGERVGPVDSGLWAQNAPSMARESLVHYGFAGKDALAAKLADTATCPEFQGNSGILGQSEAMTSLREQIYSIRKTTETVLITGETGSGKELIAQMIHEQSPVSTGPFVPCNVSCIAESLAESLLFGSSRGSYTGSVRESKGLFEAANGGTLFLDEIGELSPSVQPKLLRVLEDGAVCRLGSYERRPVRFRLICATHRDLVGMVAARRFRPDLFYRIDILRVESPPLRSHPEDIPALASRCLIRHRKVLSPRALEKLKGYTWPGNVRQLLNCLSRAACAANGAVIDCDLIDF